MSTTLITRLRRSMSEVGVETVLTLAFVAKLAAGTSIAHAMVASVVGHQGVVLIPDARTTVEVRAVMPPAEIAELRALAQAHRGTVAAARAAARAHARRDSMVRVTVVGPDGRVERRVVAVRER